MTYASRSPDHVPLAELTGVTKVYGEGPAAVHALRGIDLRIDTGEFIAMMGPSGSGKSTCLNILGCLDAPTTGVYRFRGADVTHLGEHERALLRRNALGFVFQSYNLLERTTALDNVEMPLIYHGVHHDERRERARAALDLVGLSGRETHTPAELSGGQQQRVAIARAIVTEPALLLADEPTGNLDSRLSHEIVELVAELNATRGLTIVMVTHELDIAAYARRVVRFSDGRVVADQPQASDHERRA